MRLPLPPAKWANRLALPLRLAPAQLNNTLVAGLLGRVFAAPLEDGELDFLDQHAVSIHLRDLGLTFDLRMQGRRLIAGAPGRSALWIQGEVFDFLSLLSGREDPDTLFFQRRLRMQGDTALGVHLKNFFAALEPERLPAAQWILPRLAPILAHADHRTPHPETRR